MAKSTPDFAANRVELRELAHLGCEAELPEFSEARLLGDELPAHLRQRQFPELQLPHDGIDKVGQAYVPARREEPEVVQVALLGAPRP